MLDANSETWDLLENCLLKEWRLIEETLLFQADTLSNSVNSLISGISEAEEYWEEDDELAELSELSENVLIHGWIMYIDIRRLDTIKILVTLTPRLEALVLLPNIKSLKL